MKRQMRRRRTALFVSSQLVTSATNFVNISILALALPAEEFGVSAAVLLAIGFIVGLQRATVGDILLIFVRSPTFEQLLKSSISMLGIFCAISTLALMTSLGALQIPLPVVFLGVLQVSQDGLRYVGFATSREWTVLRSDCMWFCLSGVALVLHFIGQTSTQMTIFVPVVGGLVAVSALILPRIGLPFVGFSAPAGYFKRTGKTARWLAGQFVTLTGASTAMMLLAASFVGARQYGDLRVSSLLVSPVLTLSLATASPTVRMFAGMTARMAWRRAAFLSTMSMVSAGCLLAPVVILAPAILRMFSPVHMQAATLVIPQALGVIAVAAGVPMGSALRASKRTRALFLIQLGAVLPASSLMPLAAARFGALGMAWVTFLEMLLVLIGTCFYGLQTWPESPKGRQGVIG